MGQSDPPKVIFSKDGLVPAAAGMACAMAKDGVFSSSQLSKCIHLVHASLMSSEFLKVEEVVKTIAGTLDVESVPDLYAKHFRLHGQSLKNLQLYWTKWDYWKKESGFGKKALYRISKEGLQFFMETTWKCSQGLEELRYDHILLSVYTIRTTPLSILKEVFPDLVKEIQDGAIAGLNWDWKSARDYYVRELEMKKKSLEKRAEKNSQLSEKISPHVKTFIAGAIASTVLLPGLRGSLPILGLMAFRSQRDRKWAEGPNLLRNLYQMWRPSYSENDAMDGIEFRTTGLYIPMAENIGQMIRSLERLK